MGFEFNPLKIAEDAAKAVADAADGAMHAAADVVDGAAKAAADVAGAVGDAVTSIAAPKPKAPSFRYTGAIRPGTRMIPKILYVSVMSLDAKGEPLEGRRQALSLGSKGVRLHVSDSALSAVQCEIPVGNCLLFKNGVTENGNPILKALIFGWGFGKVLGPVGAVIGAILGAGDSKRVHNEWFAEVQTRDNKEYTIKLESKNDGDALIEYLDTYMLKG